MKQWLKALAKRSGTGSSGRGRLCRNRLHLQKLEDRTTPATFTVTNTADAGAGSLRDAVAQANAAGGTDDIVFDAGLFATPQSIDLTTGQLNVTGSVNINGPGPNLVTVSGGHLSRVFSFIIPGTGTVNLSGVTLAQGNSVGDGGAIVCQDEKLNVSNSVISDSASASAGGGIAVGINGTLTLLNTTVNNNSATIGGGGLFSLDATLTVTNSTISGNTTPGDGGGIYHYDFGAAKTLTLTNSTVSGNSAQGNGGAVRLHGNGGFYGSLILRNSTVTSNKAVNGVGGGVARTSGTGTVTLSSTIVAGNANVTAPDMSFDMATPVGGDNNLVGVADAGNFMLTGANNLTGVQGAPLDAKIGPLASNGGPTQTHAVLVGSPAFNTGNNAQALTFDQRGVGFDRVSGAAADIGAFERQVNPRATATAPDVLVAGGTSHKITVTYTDDIAVNVSSIGNGDIMVSGPGGFSATPNLFSIDNGTNGTPRVATYQLNAPGGFFDLTDNGTYTISMRPTEVADTDGNFVAGGAIGSFLVAVPTTFPATNTNDNGPGSVRQALLDSNASGGLDTIDLTGISGTVLLLSPLPPITNSVTIKGPGSTKLVIDGNGTGARIFAFNIPGAGQVTLTGLTLTKGAGGVDVGNESASFTECAISGNTSAGPGGGVLVGPGGALTLSSCALTGNSAGGAGGGLSASEAIVSITTTSLSGNVSNGKGGGLNIYRGQIDFSNSAIADNMALGDGGGIYIDLGSPGGGPDIVTVNGNNNTIRGNTATRGGGIKMDNTGEVAATLSNSTISENNAMQSMGGGGIDIDPSNVILISSIVYGNTAGNPTPVANDINVDTGSSLIYSYSSIKAITVAGGTVTNAGNNLLPSQDPLLGVFMNNGGATSTFAIASNSPVRDTGLNPNFLFTDQRGFGFGRSSGKGTDMGAFEFQVPEVTVSSVQINGGAPQRSRVTTLKVTFDQYVNFFPTPASAFQLERAGDFALVGAFNATVDNTGATTVVTLDSFSGTATEFGSLADGRYSLTVFAANTNYLIGGLDYIMPADLTPNPPGPLSGIFRFFGDATGNGAVDAADFLAFRNDYILTNVVNSPFDIENDGFVAAPDFLAFRARYLITYLV